MGYKTEALLKGELTTDKLNRMTLWRRLLIPEYLYDWRVREIFCEYRKLMKTNAVLSDYFTAPPFENIGYFIRDLFPAYAAHKGEDRGEECEKLDALVLSDASDEEVLKVLIPGWRHDDE